ncbi:MAG: hypothetical protein H7A33_00190 [Deltaproteobacteria bacterium]|nr:hypothetical protein [Deltaproteobacteria bacterium]
MTSNRYNVYLALNEKHEEYFRNNHGLLCLPDADSSTAPCGFEIHPHNYQQHNYETGEDSDQLIRTLYFKGVNEASLYKLRNLLKQIPQDPSQLKFFQCDLWNLKQVVASKITNRFVLAVKAEHLDLFKGLSDFIVNKDSNGDTPQFAGQEYYRVELDFSDEELNLREQVALYRFTTALREHSNIATDASEIALTMGPDMATLFAFATEHGRDPESITFEYSKSDEEITLPPVAANGTQELLRSAIAFDTDKHKPASDQINITSADMLWEIPPAPAVLELPEQDLQITETTDTGAPDTGTEMISEDTAEAAFAEGTVPLLMNPGQMNLPEHLKPTDLVIHRGFKESDAVPAAAFVDFAYDIGLQDSADFQNLLKQAKKEPQLVHDHLQKILAQLNQSDNKIALEKFTQLQDFLFSEPNNSIIRYEFTLKNTESDEETKITFYQILLGKNKFLDSSFAVSDTGPNSFTHGLIYLQMQKAGRTNDHYVRFIKAEQSGLVQIEDYRQDQRASTYNEQKHWQEIMQFSLQQLHKSRVVEPSDFFKAMKQARIADTDWLFPLGFADQHAISIRVDNLYWPLQVAGYEADKHKNLAQLLTKGTDANNHIDLGLLKKELNKKQASLFAGCASDNTLSEEEKQILKSVLAHFSKQYAFSYDISPELAGEISSSVEGIADLGSIMPYIEWRVRSGQQNGIIRLDYTPDGGKIVIQKQGNLDWSTSDLSDFIADFQERLSRKRDQIGLQKTLSQTGALQKDQKEKARLNQIQNINPEILSDFSKRAIFPVNASGIDRFDNWDTQETRFFNVKTRRGDRLVGFVQAIAQPDGIPAELIFVFQNTKTNQKYQAHYTVTNSGTTKGVDPQFKAALLKAIYRDQESHLDNALKSYFGDIILNQPDSPYIENQE